MRAFARVSPFLYAHTHTGSWSPLRVYWSAHWCMCVWVCVHLRMRVSKSRSWRPSSRFQTNACVSRGGESTGRSRATVEELVQDCVRRSVGAADETGDGGGEGERRAAPHVERWRKPLRAVLPGPGGTATRESVISKFRGQDVGGGNDGCGRRRSVRREW